MRPIHRASAAFERCRPAWALIGTALLLAQPARAQDRADLERARIVGSRELPKVTYIVPWRKPSAEAPGARLPPSVLDEALSPVDPEVHRRQVGGHARWLQVSAAPALPPGSPAASPPPSPPPSRNPDPPQEKRP